MGGFPGRLDFHVVHQLLAAGQPDVGGDNALMGSQHQHLVFQVVLLLGFTSALDTDSEPFMPVKSAASLTMIVP